MVTDGGSIVELDGVEVIDQEPTFRDLDIVRLLRAATTDDDVCIPAGAHGVITAVLADGQAYQVLFDVGSATIDAVWLERRSGGPA